MDDECYIFVRRMQERNVSPMPIIGVYVAAASYVCTVVMTVHVVAMFRNSSFRYFLDVPHKFFALNATWLAVLAVATKLTGDLTSLMWSPIDNTVKLTSTAFLTIAMSTSFTTLGCMNNTDLVANLMALTILVFTVIVDLCIQLYTGALDYSLFPEIIWSIVLLFSMFIIIVCSALAVPAIKKRAELNYQKLASQMELGQQHLDKVEELRLSVTKYWVMATSGSPQLLLKRLVTFPLNGIICLLSAAIFCQQIDRMEYEFGKWKSSHCQQESDYKNSVDLIIRYQFPILLVSEINCVFSLNVVLYKYEDSGIKFSREEFTVEFYWTEKLEEWRQSSIPIWIKRLKLRKFIHNIKAFILTFCIRLQTVIVMWCKFCWVLYFYSMLPLVILDYHLKKLIHKLIHKNDQRRPEIDLDLNCFVILLEGEKQFPEILLRLILRRVGRLVERGKKHRPQNLFNLLNQSFIFRGVVDYDDSNRIPSLLSGEPPNCWTLPVVTLTTIAIALPNIATQHADELVSGVDQGLYYARLVDILDEKCKLKSITNAADFVWDGVSLHNKWLDIDLDVRKSKEEKSAKEIIQTLAGVAEKIVMEFSSTQNTILIENPLYWPANVVAANSMYRISRTLLLLYENSECQAEELFSKLVCMIADILAACLTNLPLLIATKCRCNAIEEREKSVHDAAILFGNIEDILKRFEERQLLSIGRPSQPLCIDEWRRYMMERQLIPTIISASATTNNNGASSVESNEQVAVQMQV